MKQIYLTLAAAALMMPCVAGAQSLVVEPVTGAQGETVTMNVDLNNPGMSIVSFDFDIRFPDGVAVARDSEDEFIAELTSRKADHVVDASILSDGFYKVVSYSSKNRAFKEESGIVLKMSLLLNAAPGEYEVSVRNIVINDISTGDIVGHDCENLTFSLTVTEPKELEVDRHVDNQFFCPDITVSQGEDATFKLYYDSTSEVYNYECDVILPAGVGIENIAFDEGVETGKFTNYYEWIAAENKLNVFGNVNAKKGAPIEGGKVLLLTATLITNELPAGEYTIVVNNQTIVNEDEDDHKPAAYVVNLVVKGNAAPSVMNLADGTPYTNGTDYDNIDVTYTRNFEHQEWQALYIPFNMSYEEWSDKAEVARINAVHQFDRNGDGDYDDVDIDETTVEFVVVNGGELRPNTPYVIRPKQTGEVTFECTGKTLLAAPAQGGSVWCASTQRKYTLTGVYQAKNDMDGFYAMRNGWFMLGTASSPALAPYRFYLTIENVDNGYGTPDVPAAAPSKMKIIVNGSEDTPTGIDEMVSIPADNVYYDLMGRRVENPAKGIYIVNGKKVILK